MNHTYMSRPMKALIKRSSLVLGIVCGLLTWIVLILLQDVLPFSRFITKVAIAVTLALVLYVVGLIQQRPSFAVGYGFGLCGTFLVAIAGLYIVLTIKDYAERTSFEKGRWERESESGIRVRMVDDLLHSDIHLQAGRSNKSKLFWEDRQPLSISRITATGSIGLAQNVGTLVSIQNGCA